MHKLKIAYFGTPTFSAQLLEKIINDKGLPIEIVLVVTQPDKPVGRQLTITPSPVKEIAKKYNIDVWDANIDAEDDSFFSTRATTLFHKGALGAKKKNVEASLKSKLNQIDLALVFAYGFKRLIPLDLLKAPKMQFDIGEKKTSGFINIHPSLLPNFRGSSPIAYPILLGESKTGISLFVMDEKMDHGPIIAQKEMTIGLNDVRPDMEKKLTDLGFQMIKKLLIRLATGDWRLAISNQNHALMTRSPFMKREDGFIPLETLTKALKNELLTPRELPHLIAEYHRKYTNGQYSITNNQRSPNDHLINENSLDIDRLVIEHSAKLIYDFWRGMHPWPGIWTILPNKKRLKIISLSLSKLPTTSTRGRSPFGRNYQLQIKTVQLEGKKEVDFATFQKAYNLL